MTLIPGPLNTSADRIHFRCDGRVVAISYLFHVFLSGRESSTRLRYQNQTDGNYRELVKLIEAVTAIHSHDKQAALKIKVEELENKLVTEREEKIELQDHTNKLRNSLEVTTLKIKVFVIVAYLMTFIITNLNTVSHLYSLNFSNFDGTPYRRPFCLIRYSGSRK